MKGFLQALINAVLICAFFDILKLTQCTSIFAELDVADYCTDQRSVCRHTGSLNHIVCDYYGKTKSSCSRFEEVALDQNNVNDILNRINTMRIQVAKGEALGEGERLLPRAYGMMNVFWDSELAAFAKIMINQCLAKHKYSCAASKNFTNPTMIYSFANTTSSAKAIIDNIFLSWEAAALVTSPDDIFHSPDLKGRKSRFYLKMVVGALTHVGCAVGVYEHEIRDSNTIRLSGHIICYVSHYLRAGTVVYNTTSPVRGTGWTKCGCPPKYRDTKGCLCVPSPSTAPTTSKPQTTKHMEFSTSPRLKAELTERQQRDSKTELLDWLTNQNLKWTKQQGLNRELQEILEPKKQQKLTWTPQQKLTWTPQQKLKWTPPILKQSTGAGTPAPTCNAGGNCVPKIVMMPIFTIQNAPKDSSNKKGAKQYRRFISTSLVQNAKSTDDFSLSDEKDDELLRNTRVESKLLQTVSKIKKKENTDFFSHEENLEPDSKIERSERILERFKRIIEYSTSIPEFSSSVPTTTEKSLDDRNDNAKKRVMNLLDLLEEKGSKAQLNSREIIEFDAKMRRIYKSVLGTHDELQF